MQKARPKAEKRARQTGKNSQSETVVSSNSGASNPEDILSFEEAMKLLGTSQPTLYRLLKQGAIQGLKVGRQWRFRRADLVAYMECKPGALSQAAHSEADEVLQFLQEKLGREIALPDGENSEERKTAGIANGVLSLALEAGASDVHFEPKSNGLLIRQRLDGVLHEIHNLPASLTAPIVHRLKVMADLDINEKRLPQEGRIHLKYQERQFNGGVASCPSAFGESITLRLLDTAVATIGLERLNLHNNEDTLKKWLHSSHGLILITGPTESGKTTTLYSCVSEVAGENKKTVTIEDPVEYTLPYTTQTWIDRKAGLSCASALRAFMRQDPDVIMIGELADLESAQAALQAAIAGHLVLTCIHTDSATSTITRLLDWGIEPFLLNAALLGISNQRLVRRVCPDCQEEYKPDAAALKKVRELAAKGGYEMPKNARFVLGKGCIKCRQTGYRGRVGIYELLENNEAMRAAILARNSASELQQIALQSDMILLFADGVRKAIEGITTLDEVLRVMGVK